MPVKLEHIHQPTDADWADINKIHQETHDGGLSFNQEQLAAALSTGSWIMAGRFNDRIIGLIIATETDEGIVLTQAGVRTITQRRGVIHQLLHFIQQWATGENKSLIIQSLPDALQTPAEKRGFVKNDSLWQYN